MRAIYLPAVTQMQKGEEISEAHMCKAIPVLTATSLVHLLISLTPTELKLINNTLCFLTDYNISIPQKLNCLNARL